MQFTPFAKVTHMYQWNGTANNLTDVQNYIAQVLADRPWSDEQKTVKPDNITAVQNADQSLTLTMGKYVYNVKVGDWMSKIRPRPMGEWDMQIVPDTAHKQFFGRATAL